MNIDVIMDKLNSMKRGEIAGLMESEGVTGIREAAAHCVVAEYIKKNIDDNTGLGTFGVSPSSIMVANRHYEPSFELAQFIREFDMGWYPRLSTGNLSALEREEIDIRIKEYLQEVV